MRSHPILDDRHDVTEERAGRSLIRVLRRGLLRGEVGRVDGVGEVHEVPGHSQLMCARGDQRETQEHEGSDQWGLIDTILLEADDHLATAENIFRMLEQCNKTLFRAFRQNVARNLDEESLANEKSVPVYILSTKSHAETEVLHSIVRSLAAAALESYTAVSNDDLRTFDTDRGLFRDPHTVALCLATRYIYGVGDIRSTVEALDQWV